MTHIVAILNVTPDSFSDGGRFDSAREAVAEGIRLRDAGADLVDVGGESTRPGAARVSPEEEQDRVIPVVRGLVAARVEVSVDTMNASTARAAAKAGASIINDVTGGLADPDMLRVIAETGIPYIASHSRGETDAEPRYDDVVTDVRNELRYRLAEMAVYGIDPARVILDPGLGFAKTADHNWQLLSRLDELATLGHPILVGASRKRFLAPWGERPEQRDAATAVISALAARAGAWGVRVHDVESTRLALGVESAWKNGHAP
ncbi:dihydropteroate synthase [Microbacteriaceae bacterium SG_E_30_P1]|uniref:Dihydropteroate synthase n=1 Tax=Antiquaquibacter oligotrophicus TaxID=2880260 RepID=A0ABT6KIV8_9MICO|nr:dihydropteroate synthase [Antiquaquibacter oligotrophicus]MDH6179826.1 dihydropteroate synthase [Antiquaquibacter oligotrophicus]UDF14412.1 dihydropteroate synthase [Antiquaquibacter oligotrophicus]